MELVKTLQENVHLLQLTAAHVGITMASVVAAMENEDAFLRFHTAKCRKYTSLDRLRMSLTENDIAINFANMGLYGLFTPQDYLEFCGDPKALDECTIIPHKVLLWRTGDKYHACTGDLAVRCDVCYIRYASLTATAEVRAEKEGRSPANIHDQAKAAADTWVARNVQMKGEPISEYYYRYTVGAPVPHLALREFEREAANSAGMKSPRIVEPFRFTVETPSKSETPDTQKVRSAAAKTRKENEARAWIAENPPHENEGVRKYYESYREAHASGLCAENFHPLVENAGYVKSSNVNSKAHFWVAK